MGKDIKLSYWLPVKDFSFESYFFFLGDTISHDCIISLYTEIFQGSVCVQRPMSPAAIWFFCRWARTIAAEETDIDDEGNTFLNTFFEWNIDDYNWLLTTLTIIDHNLRSTFTTKKFQLMTKIIACFSFPLIISKNRHGQHAFKQPISPFLTKLSAWSVKTLKLFNKYYKYFWN